MKVSCTYNIYLSSVYKYRPAAARAMGNPGGCHLMRPLAQTLPRVMAPVVTNEALADNPEPTAPDILGPRGNTDLRPEKEWRNLTVQALQNKSGQLAHEMVDEFRKQNRRNGRA